MREEAERFCTLIETAESFERDEFVAAVAVSLAELLAAASTLPDLTPTNTDVDARSSSGEVRALFGAVQRVLGSWGDYQTTLAPHGDEAERAVLRPVADDLVDIWRDLKEGLLGLAEGAPEGDVIWEWRFGFYSHWGRHATEALRALHVRLADRLGPVRDSDS